MKKFVFNHKAFKVCDSIGYTQEELDAVKTKAHGMIKDILENPNHTQSMLLERIQEEMSLEEIIILAGQHLQNIVLKQISEIAMKAALGDFLGEKIGEMVGNVKFKEEKPDPLKHFFDMMAKDLQDGEIIPEGKA